jgi:hypothetical protein
MITFIIDRDYSIDDNKKYVFAEISVDSVDELPAANEAVDGKYLVAGSIALVIATGNIYVLNSLGEWIKQTGEDEDSNASNSNSTSNTLNLSPTTNIDRTALLNKSDIINSDEPVDTAEMTEEQSELEDVLTAESVIEPETAEKDGEADVLGDTESE